MSQELEVLFQSTRTHMQAKSRVDGHSSSLLFSSLFSSPVSYVMSPLLLFDSTFERTWGGTNPRTSEMGATLREVPMTSRRSMADASRPSVLPTRLWMGSPKKVMSGLTTPPHVGTGGSEATRSQAAPSAAAVAAAAVAEFEDSPVSPARPVRLTTAPAAAPAAATTAATFLFLLLRDGRGWAHRGARRASMSPRSASTEGTGFPQSMQRALANDPWHGTTSRDGTPAASSRPSTFWVYTRSSFFRSSSSLRKRCVRVGERVGEEETDDADDGGSGKIAWANS